MKTHVLSPLQVMFNQKQLDEIDSLIQEINKALRAVKKRDLRRFWDEKHALGQAISLNLGKAPSSREIAFGVLLACQDAGWAGGRFETNPDGSISSIFLLTIS